MTDRVSIGRAGRPHGLDGSFVVESPSESDERFAVDSLVWAGGERARIVSSKRSGGRRVIKLDRAVERGTPIEVDRDALPPPEPGSFYVFQLVGLEVVEEEGGKRLGRVVDIAPGPANDVVELDSGLMLPLVDTCVVAVDLERGRLVAAPGFGESG